MAKKTFQQELKETIVDRIDSKLSRKDVLEDVFKTYAAKMMEANALSNKNRLEAGFIHMMKTYLITEFRGAELGEFQMSEKWYEELFDKTIKEIFESAGNNHEGENSAMKTQELGINKRAYHNEVVPRMNGMHQTKAGIWVPG